MEDFFTLLLEELTCTDGLKINEAVGKIGKSRKAAFCNLKKIRGTALKQRQGAIIGFRPVSADTTGIAGSNVNRHDWKKLTNEELYAMAIQVLVFQERFGNTYAVIVEGLTKAIMERIIKEVVPANTTIYTDEHKSFKGIGKIKDKNYNHGTTNHSAGEHALGDNTTNPVENANSKIKKAVKAHGNNFSREGLQELLNAVVFKLNANAKAFSLYEMFTLALENIVLFGKPQAKAKVITFRPPALEKQRAVAA